MRTYARLAGCTVLAFGIWALSGPAFLGAADDKDKDKKETQDIKEARAAVLKLADSLTKKDPSVKQQIEAIAKMDLEDVMWVFKPREKFGVGVGPKAGEITPDGIELKIYSIANKRGLPSKMEVTKYGADFSRMGEIALAISETLDQFAPKEKKGDKDPKEWKKLTEDMKKGAKDLIEAGKAGDPTKIKAASTLLQGSCVTCHKVFRDPND